MGTNGHYDPDFSGKHLQSSSFDGGDGGGGGMGWIIAIVILAIGGLIAAAALGVFK